LFRDAINGKLDDPTDAWLRHGEAVMMNTARSATADAFARDHRNRTVRQVYRYLPKSIVLAVGVTIFDQHVCALDITGLGFQRELGFDTIMQLNQELGISNEPSE
jgi:hypothetical protein